jgi:hypothetical protein
MIFSFNSETVVVPANVFDGACLRTFAGLRTLAAFTTGFAVLALAGMLAGFAAGFAVLLLTALFFTGAFLVFTTAGAFTLTFGSAAFGSATFGSVALGAATGGVAFGSFGSFVSGFTPAAAAA